LKPEKDTENVQAKTLVLRREQSPRPTARHNFAGEFAEDFVPFFEKKKPQKTFR